MIGYIASFFKNYTVQHRCSQHTCTLIPMNTHTQTLPIWEHLTDLEERLIIDGNVAYHLMHNAGKSWK
jgi:hypothetical protein